MPYTVYSAYDEFWTPEGDQCYFNVVLDGVWLHFNAEDDAPFKELLEYAFKRLVVSFGDFHTFNYLFYYWKDKASPTYGSYLLEVVDARENGFSRDFKTRVIRYRNGEEDIPPVEPRPPGIMDSIPVTTIEPDPDAEDTLDLSLGT